MSWPSSLLVALLTAVLGALSSGLVAGLAMDWYKVSSFEGKSGYYVIFIALMGFVGGLVIGLVASRLVAAGASPGFGKGMGWSALVVLVIATSIAGVARLLADVPPTIAGEELTLLVEVRWPASQQQLPGTVDAVPRGLQLGALSAGALRASKKGPLWMEDARYEDGHWIVPGAVEIFTSRGKRVLNVDPQLPGAMGLMLPLGGHPGRQDLAWSDWMPRARSADSTAAGGGFSYRFKVLARDQAVRTEKLGPFEVDTIARAFQPGDRAGALLVAVSPQFAMRYRGRPVVIDANSEAAQTTAMASGPALEGSPNSALATRVEAVATLPGKPDALLVRVASAAQEASCRLLVDEGTHVSVKFVAHCTYMLEAEPLTNDRAWRDAAKLLPRVNGRIDRSSFMHPGSYLFADAIFDAEQRTVRSIAGIHASYNHGVAPMGISPDGLSFVRLGFSETERDAPALLVFDTSAKATYRVAIDRTATRVGSLQGLDSDWLAHYYRWERNAGGHGRLTARSGVVPLPFRGVVEVESSGNLVYHLQPAGKPMLDVLSAFLRDEFKAQQTPEDAKSQGSQTHIGDAEVHLFHNESEHYVSIYLPLGNESSTLVPRIAARFNASLATGQYDTLFTP